MWSSLVNKILTKCINIKPVLFNILCIQTLAAGVNIITKDEVMSMENILKYFM